MSRARKHGNATGANSGRGLDQSGGASSRDEFARTVEGQLRAFQQTGTGNRWLRRALKAGKRKNQKTKGEK